jgi:hypothetical protein
MKKSLPYYRLTVVAVALVVLSMVSSCQKNYTCVCKTTVSSGRQFGTVKDSTVFTITEKSTYQDAVSWCAQLSSAPGIPNCAISN